MIYEGSCDTENSGINFNVNFFNVIIFSVFNIFDQMKAALVRIQAFQK